MKLLKALQSLSKGIKRGDFKPNQSNLLWHMFQTLVGAYQRENKIMFLALPDNDRDAICKWIDALEPKEVGSYRLVVISAWFGPSEMEYDSLLELEMSIREHRDQQYLMEGFIDYVDGTSDRVYPA